MQSAIKIKESLTITEVLKCYSEWAIAQDVKELTVDASEVKNIDAAGLQLILNTINCVQVNNGEIYWKPSPSEYFISQVNLAGMMSALQLMRGESK